MSEDILTPIPRSNRIYGFVDNFLIWAGANICIPTLFTGGLIAPKLGILYSIVVILIASTIGGFILGLIALLGSKYGLPTMVLTRKVIGLKNSYIASIFNVIQLIGWSSILLYVSSEALKEAGSYISRNSIISNYIFWVILIGIIQIIYISRGIEKITIIHRIAVITLMIVLGIESYYLIAFMFSKGIYIDVSGIKIKDILWGIDMVLATAVSWAPLVADYSRFSISEHSALMGTWWGYTITSYILYSLGALGAVVAGAYLGDPTLIAIKLGLSVLILYFVAISAITTNLINIYSAVISTKNIYQKISYRLLVVLYGLIIIAISITPIFITNFEAFLYYIGDIFIPLIILLIVGLYRRDSEKGRNHIINAVIWWVAVAISILITLLYGFGSSIIGISATILIYLLISRYLGCGGC